TDTYMCVSFVQSAVPGLLGLGIAHAPCRVVVFTETAPHFLYGKADGLPGRGTKAQFVHIKGKELPLPLEGEGAVRGQFTDTVLWMVPDQKGLQLPLARTL